MSIYAHTGGALEGRQAVEQDDELSTLGVRQIDASDGLPLTCETHREKYWCACRGNVVTEGLDGPVLWHTMLIRGALLTKVNVNITKDTVFKVLLSHDQWLPDREQTHMEVRLSAEGAFAKVPPFSENHDLLRLGSLNFDEGRGVLRELIMNRFAPILMLLPQARCNSKHHLGDEMALYKESRKNPARRWDWDYETFLNQGTCPPCKKRADSVFMQAFQRLADELQPKATAGDPKPWEAGTNRSTITPRRKKKPHTLSPKDFRPTWEPASPNADEDEVPF